MSEIKTEPVVATHIAATEIFLHGKPNGDRDNENRGSVNRVPGSFRISEPDSDGEQTFWYCCPCGCGSLGTLTVGNGFKPADGPSWHWNGSLDSPTLTPSVHHVGHWHGWLTDGVWRSC